MKVVITRPVATTAVLTLNNKVTATVARTIARSTVSVSGIQGPKGDDGAGVSLFSATNKSGVTLLAGTVAASHSSGVGVVGASAQNDTKPAIGIVTANAADLAAASIQTSGPLTLANWSNSTGSATLSANATYWLSTTTGLLTTTPPTTPGNTIQIVGRAVSTDTMIVDIQPHITL